jgi:hypothetical protein
MIRNEDGSLACICCEHRAMCDCVEDPAPRRYMSTSAQIALGVLLGLFAFFLFIAATAAGII